MNYNHQLPQPSGSSDFTAYSKLEVAYALTETPGYEALGDALRRLVNIHLPYNTARMAGRAGRLLAFHELLWRSSLWRVPHTLRAARYYATMEATTKEEKLLKRCGRAVQELMEPQLPAYDEEFLTTCHEVLYSSLSKLNQEHFGSIAGATFHLCDSMERAIQGDESAAYGKTHEAAKAFVYELKDKHGTTPEWRELLDRLEVRALLQGYSTAS